MSHINQALRICARTGLVALTFLTSLNAEASDRPRIAGPAKAFDAAIPIAYYDKSLEFTLTTAGFTPPVQSRAFAYMGIALYESVRPGMSGYASIARELNRDFALPRRVSRYAIYNWALTANSALAEVMRGLWGDATNKAAQNVAAIDAMEAAFEAEYSAVPASIRARSIAYGHAVGAAVFAASTTDGGHQGYLTNFPPYTPPVGAGLWVPLPGQSAMQPYWHVNVAPFVIPSATACAPSGPPEFSKDPASEFYAEAREVYDVGNQLTPEQRATALFWADGPGSIWGTGHGMNIVTQLIAQKHARLDTAARLYAQAGLAQADAIIGCWASKYTHNLVRPMTYINELIDPNWKSALFPTPPFPEYPSAHSVQSAAIGRVLDGFFPHVAFTDHSHDAQGFAPRHYADQWEAFEETAISRLYGGIHFRSAIYDGLDQGRCIANRVRALRWKERRYY
jgi:hypothetical protein